MPLTPRNPYANPPPPSAPGWTPTAGAAGSATSFTNPNGSSGTRAPTQGTRTPMVQAPPLAPADVAGRAAGRGMGGPPGAATGAAAPASPAAAPTYGTASGPGILQQWFNERANGTDPGYQYAMNRNTTNLANQYAARGGYNSGAAMQGQSDMLANMAAQREGQLDTLAGGASGERQGAINSMFNQGLGIAGGESGTMGQYDLGGANAMNTANQAIIAMNLNKAGVPGQANQSGISNLIKLGSLA